MTDFEPAMEACQVLAHLIAREVDPVRKGLLLRDYKHKSIGLPANERSRLNAIVSKEFLTEEAKALAEADTAGAIAQRTKRKVDVAILTVTPTELEMALRAFAVSETAFELYDRADRYWFLQVESAQSKTPLSLVVAMVGDQRNAPCAVAVTQLYERLSVDCFVLLGICAGIKGRVALGDVITPGAIWDAEGGKREVGRVLPRPVPTGVPRYMTADLGYYRATERGFYSKLLAMARDLGESVIPLDLLGESWRPVRHNGAIVSVETVVVDGLHERMRESIDDHIRGLDMESHGFATACSKCGATKWGVFRGVSDYGVPKEEADRSKKGDEFQYAAALAAAVMLRDFLETQYIQPLQNSF